MSFDRKFPLYNYKKLIVAYSGGIDSHCLLHMLAQDSILKPKICAVHINHGLHKEANSWGQHCQKICDDLDIPLQIINLNIKLTSGDSLESVARTDRYAALAKLIAPNEVLLTAHHLDDQAETTLLQLFRGSGVAGLAAMPSKKAFADGWHLRPLLEMTRQELSQYAEAYQLHWIEDDSNQDITFLRNYLRHNVMPVLKETWPSVARTIARSSQNCGQTISVLQELAELDLQNCLATNANTLSLKNLAMLSIARQTNVLRFWLRQLTTYNPSQNILSRILHELIDAKADAQPTISWNGRVIRRFQNNLYCILESQSNLFNREYIWDWQIPFSHNNLNLVANTQAGFGLDKEKLPIELKIKFREGGEKIKPHNRPQTHSLKKLFQEWKVPPWQRNTIPLIFANNDLIAVIGYCYHNDYMVAPDKEGVVLEKY